MKNKADIPLQQYRGRSFQHKWYPNGKGGFYTHSRIFDGITRDFILLPQKIGELFHYFAINLRQQIMSANFSALRDCAMSSDWIYISGITLASSIGTLIASFSMTANAKSRDKIVFDDNFRPRLWSNKKNALEWHTRLACLRYNWLVPR